MKNKKTQASRRTFLRGSMQQLVAAPLAAVATAAPSAGEETSVQDAVDEVLPGDLGYRDPETYGNLATYGGGNDVS